MGCSGNNHNITIAILIYDSKDIIIIIISIIVIPTASYLMFWLPPKHNDVIDDVLITNATR